VFEALSEVCIVEFLEREILSQELLRIGFVVGVSSPSPDRNGGNHRDPDDEQETTDHHANDLPIHRSPPGRSTVMVSGPSQFDQG
jgi:hypothetical protein